jgi:hypothetical protein
MPWTLARSDASAYRPRRLYQLVDDWTFDGINQGDELGYAVSAAGNVNGDDYADIIVGAPKAQDGVYKEGVAYVFHGSAGGLDGTPDWTAGGGIQGADFGAAVSAAGDVNGDGYADVVVGAPGYKNGETQVGAALVYHGSPGGLGPTPDWRYLSDLQSSQLGGAVSAAGDVNGDGYADVVIGAWNYSEGDLTGGAAFLFLGSADGLGDAPAWTAGGGQAGARFGAAVAGAGDVDGDGYDDVIVGAPGYDAEETDGGAIFLFYGSDHGLNETPGWQAHGDRAGAEFGAAVGAAGDVNADGYADVIVGAPSYADDQTEGGAAFAFYGSANGPGAAPRWTAYGDGAGAGFGVSVGAAGDVNGGGYDDVVVGAYRYSGGETDNKEGATFVFRGSAVGLGANHFWMAAGGKAETEFGRATASAGDVDGDGLADVIVGAPKFKTIGDPRGRAFLFLGSESPDPPVYRLYLPLALKTGR